MRLVPGAQKVPVLAGLLGAGWRDGEKSENDVAKEEWRLISKKLIKRSSEHGAWCAAYKPKSRNACAGRFARCHKPPKAL